MAENCCVMCEEVDIPCVGSGLTRVCGNEGGWEGVDE